MRTARLLAAALSLGTAGHAAGQITVTNLNDSGAGSLREALANANNGDTIGFGSLSGTLNLSSQLIVDDGVTINGNGITLDGQDTTRIFFIDAGGQSVALNGLTLQNGRGQGGDGGAGGGDTAAESGAGGGGGLGGGGAVFVSDGSLTLTDVSLTNNQARGGNGGAFITGGGSGGGGGGGGGGGIEGEGGNGSPFNGSVGSGGPGGSGGGGNGGQGFDLFANDGDRAGFGGGGGGGGTANSPSMGGGSTGGAGGFGGGGGGGGAGGTGGAGGIGAGNGFGNFSSAAGGGGGGAGLGGAVFVSQGATLTVRTTGTDNPFDNNAVAAGSGANGGGNGQAAGALLFAQSLTLNYELVGSASQTLAADTVADETALTGGTGRLNFTKQGAGTLTLTGNTAFSGTLTANGGRLNVNGDASDNNTVVRADATLGGTGTVGTLGNLGGTVAPGNPVGTLNVAGNFIQTSAGTLDIAFDSTGVGRLDVTGSATVAGTLNLVELAAGVPLDTPLTFLEAGGGIAGSFATTNTVFLSGTTLTGAAVDLGANTATVTFSGFAAQFEQDANSPTGSRVGTALDDLATNNPGASVPIINAINSSPNVADALNSQGNAVANAAAVEASTALNLVSGTALNRVAGVDAIARRDAQAATQIAAADFANDGVVSDAGLDPTAYAQPLQQAFTPWVEAVGGFSEIDSDASGLGSDATTFGVVLGAEWANPRRDTVAGIFFGYTDTNTEVDSLNDDSDTLNLQLGLYGTHRFDSHWSANAAASVSYLQFDTSRSTALGNANADFDGLGLHATLEALYDLNPHDNFVVSPLAGLEVSYVERDGYNESGAGALNLTVQDSDNTHLTTLLGLQVAGTVETSSLRLTPSARFAWALQTADDNASTTSSFSAAAASTFTTDGASRERSSARIDVGLDLQPLQESTWAAFARYTTDLTDGAQDHVVRVGMRFAF